MENEPIIQAVGDYALCKKLGQEDREVNGILISNSQQSLLSKAEIITVGDGEKISKLGLKPGDQIYYNEIEMNSVAIDGNGDGGYFIRHDCIFGKITN